MGKKVGGTLFVCLVTIAIVASILTAVVVLIGTTQEDKGCGRTEQEDFFCCNDLKTKLLISQVKSHKITFTGLNL